MYRHLLVPIDETDLSAVTIGKAVDFARSLGARITFFHAQIQHTAAFIDAAEVVRVTDPEDFVYSARGHTRELLTKAESAARAQGVTSAVACTVGDAPYAAIIAAARAAKCDLIFMGSHGRRSDMMLSSQTQKVLMNSEIPVLVSSTQNPPLAPLACDIIRDEHRSLATVLHAWLHLGKTSIAGGGAPLDHSLLRAMIHYLRAFPLALHHPKESEYLFALLRKRTGEFNAELDELERQHERDQVLVDALARAVEDYCNGKIGVVELDDAVNRYAVFMWEHMGREEGVIIPAAQRELTAADWDQLNEAFSHNQDPRFSGSTDIEFRHLYSRIVNLTQPVD